jgi:hypothetical protein
MGVRLKRGYAMLVRGVVVLGVGLVLVLPADAARNAVSGLVIYKMYADELSSKHLVDLSPRSRVVIGYFPVPTLPRIEEYHLQLP